jgi:hypothetical protein
MNPKLYLGPVFSFLFENNCSFVGLQWKISYVLTSFEVLQLIENYAELLFEMVRWRRLHLGIVNRTLS